MFTNAVNSRKKHFNKIVLFFVVVLNNSRPSHSLFLSKPHNSLQPDYEFMLPCASDSTLEWSSKCWFRLCAIQDFLLSFLSHSIFNKIRVSPFTPSHYHVSIKLPNPFILITKQFFFSSLSLSVFRDPSFMFYFFFQFFALLLCVKERTNITSFS